MLSALKAAMKKAAEDPNCKAAILTGSDPYYCAGVDLSGTMKLMHPKKLHAAIVERNQDLFDQFLDFPKPIVAAINGPAIGASVTSATLCDAIIASKEATFLTPFARLAVPPEGCSSVHFEHLMGKEAAGRMLGPEGFKPNGEEAYRMGLVTQVVEHNALHASAVTLAKELVLKKVGRTHMGFTDTKTLKEVNRKESISLASEFLGEKFLKSQVLFLESKGKSQAAWTFKLLVWTRPIWSKLL